MLSAAAVPAAAAPEPRCTFTDERLAEVSGLVVGPDGPLVVNDSGNPNAVYRLDDRCGVVEPVPFEQGGSDVEDLARSTDGTLWIADIGDNRRQRPTVALVRLAPGGRETLTPLAYADGPHDAETLLLPADGRPVIVTKDAGGRSGVYTTDAPLPPVAPPDGGAVTLRRVGEVALPPTTTLSGSAEASAVLGGGLLTGGALSADGRVAALRTYTDAWLYPVAGDTADEVVAGLRAGPVQVPLPGEPQGEAVAFTPDGTLLSAGESPDEVGPAATSRRGTLRAVPGAVSQVQRGPGTPTPRTSPTPVWDAPPSPSQEEDPMDPLLWIGVAVAVIAGGGGVLFALRSSRRR